MNVFCKSLVCFLSVLYSSSTLAGKHAPREDKYLSPVISFTAKNSKHRNISEFNFMLPMIQAENSLFLSDIKIKADDRKNAEYNLGLAYRRNISDQYIIGMYSYFDRKTTFNDLLINQWTAGAEVLSNYIDVRANIYVPENKKKVISSASVELVRDKTRIYGLKKNAQEEHALPGYDIELGVPVFGGGSWLNEKLETKFYVTRYLFKKENIAKNIGTQLRIEQPVFNNYFNPQNLELKLSIGSNFTNKKKMDNFLGLSFRMALGENSSNFSKVGLKKRMLDTIVRDVDIVTSYQQFNSVPTPVFLGDKLIENVYFVGDTNNDKYIGDGSYEKPFSKAQLLKLKKDKQFVEQSSDLILPIQLDKELNSKECDSLIKECTRGCTMTELHYLKAESMEFSLEEYFPELEKIKSIKNNLIETVRRDSNRVRFDRNENNSQYSSNKTINSYRAGGSTSPSKTVLLQAINKKRRKSLDANKENIQQKKAKLSTDDEVINLYKAGGFNRLTRIEISQAIKKKKRKAADVNKENIQQKKTKPRSAYEVINLYKAGGLNRPNGIELLQAMKKKQRERSGVNKENIQQKKTKLLSADKFIILED